MLDSAAFDTAGDRRLENLLCNYAAERFYQRFSYLAIIHPAKLHAEEGLPVSVPAIDTESVLVLFERDFGVLQLLDQSVQDPVRGPNLQFGTTADVARPLTGVPCFASRAVQYRTHSSEKLLEKLQELSRDAPDGAAHSPARTSDSSSCSASTQLSSIAICFCIRNDFHRSIHPCTDTKVN